MICVSSLLLGSCVRTKSNKQQQWQKNNGSVQPQSRKKSRSSSRAWKYLTSAVMLSAFVIRRPEHGSTKSQSPTDNSTSAGVVECVGSVRRCCALPEPRQFAGETQLEHIMNSNGIINSRRSQRATSMGPVGGPQYSTPATRSICQA